MLLESLKVRLPEEILFQEVDGGTVLLNAVNGEYYGLNEIGTRIWERLQQGQSPAELVDSLLQEYEVSPELLGRDVGRFLEHLQTRGLIEIQDAVPGANAD